MDHAGWTFLCGAAPVSDVAFVARERDDLAATEVAASTFYCWNSRNPDVTLQWFIYDSVVNWRARTMASIKPQGHDRLVVALGSKGQYLELEPLSMKQVFGEMDSPVISLRRLISIGDDLIAVGMGRSVRIRQDRGLWSEIGPGTTEADAGRIVGFEGLDGTSPTDLYAAGWRGEIWHRAASSWRQVDSPTNANLNAVACIGETIYVVGDNGTMVRGEADRWSTIDTGRPENLLDVATFEGEVFVVTDYKILKLAPTGLVPEDRFPNGDAPATCLHLLRAVDGLISLGPKDMFRFAGGFWTRVI